MVEKTIYYHDTDAIGIVYYGSYLKFLEEGRTDFLESQGIPVKKLHEQGKFFIIVELKVQYKKPARFGDVVVCESNISRVTDIRIFFTQRIYSKKDQSALAEAEVVLAIIDKEFKPIVLSERIKGLLSTTQHSR